jgi:hypothetical protein
VDCQPSTVDIQIAHSPRTKFSGTMRKEEFINLTIPQKIKTLYLEGSFVVAIRYYRHKVNLYLLGDEYVEVFYNHKLDKIDKIEFLARKHSRMKFYLDQIKL